MFLFLLAVAARRYGIRLHAFCVMSNHFHLVLTDPLAQLPAFQQFLDALVARAMNASLGRWEAFWAPTSYSAVRLVSPSDVVDKAAYVLANPAAAGLVRSGRLWPGVWSDPEQIGRGALEVARPPHFFAKRSALPEKLGLELTVPPGFDSSEQFRERVLAALADREKDAARGVKGGFRGALWVLRQKPTGRPSTVEPRRRLNPRVAARDAWRRIEALTGLAAFQREYRSALAAWCAGERDVVFPAGTYLLRVAHGATCAGSG